MTIKATIRNDEPAGSPVQLQVTVVTVGNNTDVHDRHELLAPGAETSVTVGPGQFVMLDDKEA